MVLGLTIGGSLRGLLLPAAASYSNAVDDKALFRLVAKTSSLFRSRRSWDAVDNVKLSVLPASNT